MLIAAAVVAVPKGANADTVGLAWPATGTVSTNAAEHKSSEGEFAIDIANGGVNIPVVAAAAGTVVVASGGGNTACHKVDTSSNGFGNYITLRHGVPPTATYTTYAHLAAGG